MDIYRSDIKNCIKYRMATLHLRNCTFANVNKKYGNMGCSPVVGSKVFAVVLPVNAVVVTSVVLPGVSVVTEVLAVVSV